MATPVTLSTSRAAGGHVVVTAMGELDMSNIEIFQKSLSEAVAQMDGTPVEVDLAAVEYLDSGAINALFGYVDRIRLRVNPILMPVLQVSGLTDVVNVESAGRPSNDEG
jgi:anti-anti-sigma factor